MPHLSWSTGFSLIRTFSLVGAIGPSLFSSRPVQAREIRIPLDQTIVDGTALRVQPGDVLQLESGTRAFLRFRRLTGAPGHEITITNFHGLVVVRNDNQYFDFSFEASRYFRLSGSRATGHRLGIQLAGTNPHGSALIIAGLSSDCEVDHVEISHPGFAGMLIKTDGAIGSFMDQINLHDNYVHDTGAEGFYLGETKTPGQTLRHVHVWNNVTARTGYEAIQIANAATDVRVEHNVFYRAGLREELWQDNNVQLSAATTVEFSRNLVIGATSNLASIFGGAPKRILENFFSSSVGGPAFFVRDNNVPALANSTIELQGNFIREISPTQPIIIFTGEKSGLRVVGNQWSGGRVLLKAPPMMDLGRILFVRDNIKGKISAPHFIDEAHDDFRLRADDFYRARGMGLLP